ncbi:MAG: hypothetical protein WCF39_21215 [Pseudolabrys sp.]|jgi:hypothetical protein
MESSMVIFDATKSKELIEKEIAARKSARESNAVEHRKAEALEIIADELTRIRFYQGIGAGRAIFDMQQQQQKPQKPQRKRKR